MRTARGIFKNIIKRHHAEIRENIRIISDRQKRAAIKQKLKNDK